MHIARFVFLVAFTVALGRLQAATTEEPVALPRVIVRESPVTDYGMSVVTNFGVLFGGKIKWMRVGNVSPGSPAAKQGLQTNDEIYAIDDRNLQTWTRRSMLPVFFQRRFGDKVKLLVRSASTRKLRWIELAATIEERR